MVGAKLYVEGGGDAKELRTACRKGFATFLKKAGFQGILPGVVACGSRENAYDSFCTALRKGQRAFLLVDSENPVAFRCQQGEMKNWMPWKHLRSSAGGAWKKPVEASEGMCHLMVQCMETWFLADGAAMASFFGQGFNEKALPQRKNIEEIPKKDLYSGFARASAGCKTKGPYDKGKHSFALLCSIDPAKVVEASLWARRFLACLEEMLKNG
ncbi:MAG TPA: DUF4276 family protein [Synergistaceae bacterium]|nr:DUF4276 family protein [Synergistaceae bacterium]HPJ27116.1 DUF4276 family protein [Synergistaceae bacterium]HPQ38557.1 DUF4276 family protein [Synergistaceae bacterium]